MARDKRAGKAAARPSKSAATKKNRPQPAPRKTAARTPAAPVRGKVRARHTASVDPALFDPLTEGERADALRVLTEDRRVATMAKVARYRVVAVEPMVLKPPHDLFSHRLARVVAYDYAADRCVDALIDLDTGTVAHLQLHQSQPMLGRDEEAQAVAIALGDDRVKRELGLSDEPQAALHYWSRRDTDLAHTRRSAAVLFGQPGGRARLVAVVDLVDSQVAEVVPAEQW
jgi:Cu2+-containing amine oxidase